MAKRPAGRKAKTGRKPKPKAQRKDDSIRIRLTADQKAQLTRAAERAGLDVSAWLRALGIRAASAANDDSDR